MQDSTVAVPGPGGGRQRQAGVLRGRQPAAGLPVVAHRRERGGGGGGQGRGRGVNRYGVTMFVSHLGWVELDLGS